MGIWPSKTPKYAKHYSNVIMGAMASQITSLAIVYSIVYSGTDQRKNQSSASLAFVRGIHRWPGEFPAQMASNADNISIWRRHHGNRLQVAASPILGKRCKACTFSVGPLWWSLQNKFLSQYFCTWWRNQIEKFSALLAICEGNSLVTGEFPSQRPVTRSFDVFFDLRLNQRLSKQWRFDTTSCSLWCIVMLSQYSCTKIASKYVLKTCVRFVLLWQWTNKRYLLIFHGIIDNIWQILSIQNHPLSPHQWFPSCICKWYHWCFVSYILYYNFNW